MNCFEDILEPHLQRVSRSFSICIARLDAPLNEWVGLAYLLCRSLDTIEDSAFPQKNSRQRCFQLWDQMISVAPTRFELKAWRESLPTPMPSELTLLVADTERLLNLLHSGNSTEVRQILQWLTLSMSKGMQAFFCLGERLSLKNLTEVNQYCFFVAGLVGEALVRLFHLSYEDFPQSEEVLEQSYHFGLFLQKINLLKDQAIDQDEGRFFVFDREELANSLFVHSDQAFRFIESIPLAATSIRRFCACSLFLGVASLPQIWGGVDSRSVGKIPRAQTLALFEQIDLRLASPHELRALFEFLLGLWPIHRDQGKGRVRQESARGAAGENSNATQSFSRVNLREIYKSGPSHARSGGHGLGGLMPHNLTNLGV